jgi:hypothetical protein
VTDDLNPAPVVRASDADREAIVTRLQSAVGEGRINLDEFGQRADAAYAAVTRADLDPLVADLPAHPYRPVEIVGQRPVEEVSSVFGDIKLAVSTSPPQRASTVFGDIQIDLRGLRTGAARIELHLSTVFGDIDVIVAEGVTPSCADARCSATARCSWRRWSAWRARRSSSSTPRRSSAT